MFQPGAVVSTAAFGYRAENVEVPFITNRSPTASDVNFPIGKRWINTLLNLEFVLTSQNSIGAILSSNWTALVPSATTNIAANNVTTVGTVTSTGNVSTAGNLVANTAGGGLRVAEGTNAKQGTATLVAGTVVVANTSVTANSRIFLTAQNLGTVTSPSALTISARTASTSFTILASQATDTSLVAYEIFEPA